MCVCVCVSNNTKDCEGNHNEVGEVDDNNGSSNEQVSIRELVFVEQCGQCEGNGSSQAAVSHNELIDDSQSNKTNAVSKCCQNQNSCKRRIQT